MSAHGEEAGEERGKAKRAEDAPGGAAQFDPEQQTRREDLDEDESGARGPAMRGSLPPGSRGDRQSGQSPAVPGSSADRGERPARDGRVGT